MLHSLDWVDVPLVEGADERYVGSASGYSMLGGWSYDAYLRVGHKEHDGDVDVWVSDVAADRLTVRRVYDSGAIACVQYTLPPVSREEYEETVHEAMTSSGCDETLVKLVADDERRQQIICIFIVRPTYDPDEEMVAFTVDEQGVVRGGIT